MYIFLWFLGTFLLSMSLHLVLNAKHALSVIPGVKKDKKIKSSNMFRNKNCKFSGVKYLMFITKIKK